MSIVTEQQENEMKQNISKYLDEVKAVEDEFRAIMSAKFAEVLTPILTEYCNTYQVDGLLMAGYTPGFNDGDVCEHGMYDMEVWSRTAITEDTLNDPDFDPEEVEIYGFSYVDLPSEQYHKARDSLIKAYARGANYTSRKFIHSLGNMFEIVYGTNVAVFYERQEDGSFTPHVCNFYYPD
jgi:hypothetical protein